MCYSHNQYNSLTPCVCPEQGYMQGETMAVNGEKVRIKLLRISLVPRPSAQVNFTCNL